MTKKEWFLYFFVRKLLLYFKDNETTNNPLNYILNHKCIYFLCVETEHVGDECKIP